VVDSDEGDGSVEVVVGSSVDVLAFEGRLKAKLALRVLASISFGISVVVVVVVVLPLVGLVLRIIVLAVVLARGVSSTSLPAS